MNFYKKILDQRVHNKAHQMPYIAHHIFFMKRPGCLNANNINHNASQDMTNANILLNIISCNYCQAFVYYIFFQVLFSYHKKSLDIEKIKIDKKRLLKY